MSDADFWAKVRADRDAIHKSLEDRPGQVSAPALLWALRKGGNEATATMRSIHGIGLELRFAWNGDLRWSQVYRDPADLREHAEAKRTELVQRGWHRL